MFHLEKLIAQYVSELSVQCSAQASQVIHFTDGASNHLPGLVFLLRFYKERVPFIPTTIDLDRDSLSAFFAEVDAVAADESEGNDWAVDVISFLMWARDCGYISETLWDALQDALQSHDELREDE